VPGRRDLEGPAPVASKAEEGSGGAIHRGIDRGSPPVVAPGDGSGRRESVPRARERTHPTGNDMASATSEAPRRVGGGRVERSARP